MVHGSHDGRDACVRLPSALFSLSSVIRSDARAVTIRVVTMDTLGVSMRHLVMVGYRRQEGRVKSC
jgi:hypothetical protein